MVDHARRISDTPDCLTDHSAFPTREETLR
jgi:hypothetical protein